MGPGRLPSVPRNFGSGVPPVLQKISHFADRDPMGTPSRQAGDKALSRWNQRTLSSLTMEQDESLHPHVPGRKTGRGHIYKNSSTQAGKKESTLSKTAKRVRTVEADTDRKGKCISEPMAELTVSHTGRRPLQRRGTGKISLRSTS